MFDRVTRGHPWYYWFKQGKEITVNRVVRDHSGGLWVSQYGHSTQMRIWLLGHMCLGPVEPPMERPERPDKTIELEIKFPEEK